MKSTIKQREDFIKRFLSQIDNKGYLKHRESTTVEFKENFNFGNMPKYAKTMSAFANNKGGYIIFGVKDGPRMLVGVKKERFDGLKLEKITEFLIEHFEPEIKWDIGIVEINGRSFGYIYTYEAEEKPVICKKNAGGNELKSGEIYYRYRAQTRKIEYPELKKIIDKFREKERLIWMKHIERIAQIGPSNVALVDLLTGTLHTTKLEGTKLIMDRELLQELRDKVKFVEEGKFSEKEGEPTLKIVGEIQAVDIVVPDLDPNKDYPYLQKRLAEELGIRPYDVQILIWKLKLKGNKKYHVEIETGTSSKVHKYSKYTLQLLKNILASQPNKTRFLKRVSKEYQKYLRSHSKSDNPA